MGGGIAAAAVGQRDVEKVGAEKPEAKGPANVPPGSRPPPAPSGPSVALTARGISFVEKELTLPAGKPVTVRFTNRDAGTPHNFALYTDKSAATKIFAGSILTGPGSTSYRFTAPPAGTYYFRCDVHPTIMNGTVRSE